MQAREALETLRHAEGWPMVLFVIATAILLQWLIFRWDRARERRALTRRPV